MALRNSSQRYGTVAQILHWLVVALVTAQVVLAAIADELPRGVEKLAVMSRHKSVGITLLALVMIRIVWRLLDRPPPLPPMPRWQRIAAHASHRGMYALLIAMPLTGWMMSSSANRPVSWFGLVQIPDLVAPSESVNHLMHELHEGMAVVLLALVALHVAAALKHQFWDRDGLLWRMLPFRRGGAGR